MPDVVELSRAKIILQKLSRIHWRDIFSLAVAFFIRSGLAHTIVFCVPNYPNIYCWMSRPVAQAVASQGQCFYFRFVQFRDRPRPARTCIMHSNPRHIQLMGGTFGATAGTFVRIDHPLERSCIATLPLGYKSWPLRWVPRKKCDR
jgi:hypothetical protein